MMRGAIELVKHERGIATLVKRKGRSHAIATVRDPETGRVLITWNCRHYERNARRDYEAFREALGIT